MFAALHQKAERTVHQRADDQVKLADILDDIWIKIKLECRQSIALIHRDPAHVGIFTAMRKSISECLHIAEIIRVELGKVFIQPAVKHLQHLVGTHRQLPADHRMIAIALAQRGMRLEIALGIGDLELQLLQLLLRVFRHVLPFREHLLVFFRFPLEQCLQVHFA